MQGSRPLLLDYSMLYILHNKRPRIEDCNNEEDKQTTLLPIEDESTSLDKRQWTELFCFVFCENKFVVYIEFITWKLV